MKDENWQQLMSQFLQVPVDLYLPRFKLEYGLTLNDVLTALGMGVAFTDLADFGGINPNVPLAITEVKHKTYVAVDEDGTEAAAATSVEVGPTGMPGHAQFVVDRPFVFAIREHKSGTILFIGKIIDPVWNSN